jgi:hypothetical protein
MNVYLKKRKALGREALQWEFWVYAGCAAQMVHICIRLCHFIFCVGPGIKKQILSMAYCLRE